jgi:hypothetical protein
MNGKPWTPQALTKLRVLYPYHPTWAFRVVQPELAIDVPEAAAADGCGGYGAVLVVGAE